MNFVVIGAGGVGCLYGAKLANAGEDVTLLDVRSDHIQKIANDGLYIDGETGPYTVHPAAQVATNEANGGANADIAVICVNGYSTADAARTALQWLKPEGYAVTLQNGQGNVEILQAILGEDRVVGGITLHSASAHDLGRVSHTGKGTSPIGELDGATSPRIKTLADVFEQAGLNPVIESDINATIWGKFVHNCALNGICALTDLRPGYIRQVPELDEFQTMLIEEAMALISAEGVALPDPNPLPAIKKFCAEKFHQPSMMQHIAKGLETEIDSLNGYLVAASAKHGLAAPYNDALTRLVKGRQFQPPNVD